MQAIVFVLLCVTLPLVSTFLASSSSANLVHLTEIYARREISIQSVPYSSFECGADSRDAPFSGLSELLDKKRIYLVGMMGSGKSTVGKILSKLLEYDFVDTDEKVEEKLGMSISNCFELGRQNQFKLFEHWALNETKQLSKTIVSTGGGIVLNDNNWPVLRTGVVVYLSLTPEAIYSRLRSNFFAIKKRPLLAKSPDLLTTLRKLTRERHLLYSKADIICHVEPTISSIQVATHVATATLRALKEKPQLLHRIL